MKSIRILFYSLMVIAGVAMLSSCIKESADVPSGNIDPAIFAPDSVAQTFRKAACGFVDDSLFVETKGALSGDIVENGSRLSYIIAVYNSQGELETSVVDPVSGVPGGMSGFTYPHVFVWNSSKSQFEDNFGFSSSIQFWGYEDDTYTVLVLGNLKGSRSELESFAGSFFSSSKNLSTVLAQSLDMQNSNMFSISSLTSFKRLPSSAVQSGFVFGTSGSFKTDKFFKKYRVRFLKDPASNYVGDSINLGDIYVNQCARYVYPFNTTSASSAVISDSSKSFSDRLTDNEKSLGFNTSVTQEGKSYLATDYIDIWVPRNIQGKSYSSINSLAKRQRSYLTSNGYSQLANLASSIVGKVNSGNGLYSSYSFEYYLYEGTSFSNFNVNENNNTQLINILLTKDYLTPSDDSSKRGIKYHWSNGNENSPGTFKTDVISTTGVRCSDVLVIDQFFCDDPGTQLTFQLDAKPSSGSRINGTVKTFNSLKSSSLAGPNSRIGYALPSGTSNVKLIANNKKASVVVNYSGFLTSLDPDEVWYLTVSDGVADPVEIPLTAPWRAPNLITSLDDKYVAQKVNVSWDCDGIPFLYTIDDGIDVEVNNAKLDVVGNTVCSSANLSFLDGGDYYLYLYSKDKVFCNEYDNTIKKPVLRLETPTNKYSCSTVSGVSTSVTYDLWYYPDKAWENFSFSYYRVNGSSLGSKFSKSDFDATLYDQKLALSYSTGGQYFTNSILTFNMQDASALKCQFCMSSYGSSTSSNFVTMAQSQTYPGYVKVYPKYSSLTGCRLNLNVYNPFANLGSSDMKVNNLRYAQVGRSNDFVIDSSSSTSVVTLTVNSVNSVYLQVTGLTTNPSVSCGSYTSSGFQKRITPVFSTSSTTAYNIKGAGRFNPRVRYWVPSSSSGSDYNSSSGQYKYMYLSDISTSTSYAPVKFYLYKTIVTHFYSAYEKDRKAGTFAPYWEMIGPCSVNGVDGCYIPVFWANIEFSQEPSIKHYGLAPVLLVPRGLSSTERSNYLNAHKNGNLGKTSYVLMDTWNYMDTSQDEKYLSNRIMRLRGNYKIGIDDSNNVVYSASVAYPKVTRGSTEYWAAEGVSCAYLSKMTKTTMTSGQYYLVGGPWKYYMLYDTIYSDTEFDNSMKLVIKPLYNFTDTNVSGLGKIPVYNDNTYVKVINGLYRACNYVGFAEANSYLQIKANQWFFGNDSQPTSVSHLYEYIYNVYLPFTNYNIL